MEKFTKPELKLIQINNTDIIRTSGEDVPPAPTAPPTPTSAPGIPGGGGIDMPEIDG